MAQAERRVHDRSPIFRLAGMRLEHDQAAYRVKVRNLSSKGLMGEGGFQPSCGTRITLDLDNVGLVVGLVAWVQDDRFGVIFDEEIDLLRLGMEA